MFVMTKLYSLILAVFLPLAGPEPTTIAGKVLDGGSKTPVSGAYVAVVEGEEEALTKVDGSFHIRSWQSLPIEVVVRHPDYQPVKLVLKKAEQPLIVRLENKK